MKSASGKRFVHALVPRYDELSLFLMGLSFLLIFSGYPELRAIPSKMLMGFHPALFPFYVLLFLFLSGLLSSLYQVATEAKKTEQEKASMLYFAVLVNGLAGFMAGVHMFQDAPGLLVVFPICNILSAVILLLMYWSGILGEHTILDADASPFAAVLGGLVVVAIFAVCRWLELHWSLTFSICMLYATNVSALIAKILPVQSKAPLSRPHVYICPACGQTVTTTRDRIGKSDICPECGEVVAVGRIKRG